MQVQKRQLELQVEDLRPKKKKKVQPDLGKKFVQIAQIKAVQQLREVLRYKIEAKGGQEEVPLRDSIIKF